MVPSGAGFMPLSLCSYRFAFFSNVSARPPAAYRSRPPMRVRATATPLSAAPPLSPATSLLAAGVTPTLAACPLFLACVSPTRGLPVGPPAQPCCGAAATIAPRAFGCWRRSWDPVPESPVTTDIVAAPAPPALPFDLRPAGTSGSSSEAVTTRGIPRRSSWWP